MCVHNPVSSLTARFQSRHAKVTIIKVNAYTEMDPDTENDEFYSVLQDTLDDIPRYDIKLLMGNFIVKVSGNWEGFESTNGPHGATKYNNNNGQWLITFCIINSLSIGNT